MRLMVRTLAELVDTVTQSPRRRKRRMVALAGAPASGKSTLAQTLAAGLVDAGCAAQVVPMDGFHLDNAILNERGLLHRKGAPETFDVNGISELVSRLGSDVEVFHPTFDRARDISIAASGVVGPACDTVVVEGNYLLLDAPIWRDLSGFWDLSVRLDVPRAALHERLVARWLKYGLSQEAAQARAQENDLPNADLVLAQPMPASVVYSGAAVDASTKRIEGRPA